MLQQNVSRAEETARALYSQLHDEVQVVGALVDVLQGHDILVLYPAEREQKTGFKKAAPEANSELRCRGLLPVRLCGEHHVSQLPNDSRLSNLSKP